MKLLERLFAVAAPDECLNCGREGAWLCADCVKLLPAKQSSCWNCNALTVGGRTCAKCRRTSALQGVKVAVRYEGLAELLIKSYKYQARRGVAGDLSRLIKPLALELNPDLIVPVPPATLRLRQRGFDHTWRLASRLGTATNLPVAAALACLDATRQVGHGRRDRLAQATGRFAATRPDLVKGQRVVILDDVITTGATMAACAAVLRQAGAREVWGLALPFGAKLRIREALL